MKIFIFENLRRVSCNFHEDGGLVVVAKDVDHVKELISNDSDIAISEEEWNNVEVFELKNETAESKYWVMPNAGCC